MQAQRLFAQRLFSCRQHGKRRDLARGGIRVQICPQRRVQRGKRHLIEAQRPRERVLFEPFNVFFSADNQPRLWPAEQLVAGKRCNIHARAQTSLHRRFAVDPVLFQLHERAAAEVFDERQPPFPRKRGKRLPRHRFGKADNAVIARVHL